MGLTIHYSLHCEAPTASDAHQLVTSLHQRACELPFDRVDPIVQLEHEDCDFEKASSEHRWLLIQAQMIGVKNEDDQWANSTPEKIIAFTIHPAEGSEPANFGLCQYSGLAGWRWSSFCKTQYASNPDLGGLKNFLRAHVGIVRLLYYARQMEILERVKDEGGYFENRDVEDLVNNVGKWNAMIAGFHGGMRDVIEAAGKDTRSLISEIAKFPNFEHLEAEGRLEKEL